MEVRTSTFPRVQMERAVGDKCGLVKDIRFVQPDRGAAEMITTELATTSLKRTLPGDFDDEPDLAVNGNGRTVSETLLTAVGEVLERYCAHWSAEYWDVPRVTAAHEQLSASERTIIDSDHLSVYDPEDVRAAGFCPFDPTLEIEWIPGRELTQGTRIFLPHGLVSLGGYYTRTEQIFIASSNGNACWNTLPGALVRSIYEVIERDAVMTTWYTQQPPIGLSLSDWPDINRFKRRFETDHVSHHVVEFDTVVDTHAIGVITVDERDRRPKFLLSASVHLDLRTAIKEAILEAAQGWRMLKHRVAFDDSEMGDIDIRSVYNLQDNVRYYMQPENFPEVEFLLEGPERSVPSPVTRSFSNEVDELRRCVELLDKAGTTPIALDITTPDVRNLGMKVTKVYVPELVDLSLPGTPPVNHPRFADTDITDRGHPFP